jgi:hypothetical protein
MRRVVVTLGTVVLALITTTGTARAAAITSSAGLVGSTTTIDFSQFCPCFEGVSGPVQIGGVVGMDIEASSTSSDLWLYDGAWGLNSNGSWNSGRDGYLGVYPGDGPVRVTFNDGPVSGFGFFANYAPGASEPVRIHAFDSGGVLLETFDISLLAPISTPGGINAGAFRGIQRGSADIAYFEYSGFAAVFDDLQFTTTAAPEPTLLSLLALGLTGVMTRRIRRR